MGNQQPRPVRREAPIGEEYDISKHSTVEETTSDKYNSTTASSSTDNNTRTLPVINSNTQHTDETFEDNVQHEHLPEEEAIVIPTTQTVMTGDRVDSERIETLERNVLDLQKALMKMETTQQQRIQKTFHYLFPIKLKEAFHKKGGGGNLPTFAKQIGGRMGLMAIFPESKHTSRHKPDVENDTESPPPDHYVESQEEKKDDLSEDVSEDVSNNVVETNLSPDTYSLMVVSESICSNTFIFSLCVIVFQLSLFLMVLFGQVAMQKERWAPFNAPINVPNPVRIAQFIALFVTVILSTDVTESVTSVAMLLGDNIDYNRRAIVPSREELSVVSDLEGNQRRIPKNEKEALLKYRMMVLIPMSVKFCQGCLALATSFIIIVQSEDVIDLFKDFLALQIISSIDNYCFALCDQGFFSAPLQAAAYKVRTLTLQDITAESPTKRKRLRLPFPLHSLVIIAILLGMTIGWGYIANGQLNGRWYSKKYPMCQVKSSNLDITKINDGKCDGGLFNRYECGFDGGDCLSYKIAYPMCNATDPLSVGDGVCNAENDNEDCGFDGGDCCPVRDDPELNNGVCNGLKKYNNEICNFDGGTDEEGEMQSDCADWNLKREDLGLIDCFVPDPSLVGDGQHCDAGLYWINCKGDNGDCQWNQLGGDVTNKDTKGRLGYRVSISSTNNTGTSSSRMKRVRVALTSLSTNNVSSSVAVYELDNLNWNLTGQPIETEYNSPDASVSLSSDGTTLAIGEPKTFFNNSWGDGYVKVYTYNDIDEDWKKKATFQDSTVSYGKSISLSSDGKRVATTGTDFTNGNHSVEVYELNNNGNWTRAGDKMMNAAEGNTFGSSIELSSDGKRVAITTEKDVQVYDWNNDKARWDNLGQRITIPDQGENFISSMSISSDANRIAVQVSRSYQAGLVIVFEYDNEIWNQLGETITQSLICNDKCKDIRNKESMMYQTIALSSDGNRLTVTDFNNEKPGKVKAYELIKQEEELSWNELGNGFGVDDLLFGVSLSMSSDGETVAVGDPKGLDLDKIQIYTMHSNKTANYL